MKFALLFTLCILPVLATTDDGKQPRIDVGNARPAEATASGSPVEPASVDRGNAAPEENVNSRYTVEAIDLAEKVWARISSALKDDLRRIVGEKFNQQLVEELSQRLRRELHANVIHKIRKGDRPESVVVTFETERRRMREDAEVTKLSYHSKQGWTGGVESNFDIGGARLRFGVQSDADTLLERFAGVNAGVSRAIGEYTRMRFDFESFHQQWNLATRNALLSNPDVPGIYRTRMSLRPSFVMTPAPGLQLSVGADFQSFETQFPAARTESANAAEGTLRYRGRWREGNDSRQELDLSYSLRAATSLLASDFVYARHLWTARYGWREGHNSGKFEFMAGAIGGTAPLFERFALGNTRTLRGWNKWVLYPVGGRQMAHGSVEYRYRIFDVFYDTGSVWDKRIPAKTRHSAGIGLFAKAIGEGPFLAVAFPLRDGRIEPMFLVSVYF